MARLEPWLVQLFQLGVWEAPSLSLALSLSLTQPLCHPIFTRIYVPPSSVFLFLFQFPPSFPLSIFLSLSITVPKAPSHGKKDGGNREREREKEKERERTGNKGNTKKKMRLERKYVLNYAHLCTVAVNSVGKMCQSPKWQTTTIQPTPKMAANSILCTALPTETSLYCRYSPCYQMPF